MSCGQATAALRTPLHFRFEALSRAVVIPMITEMKGNTEEEDTMIAKGVQCASRFFGELACISDTEKKDLKRRVAALGPEALKKMPQLTDSHYRISASYSILIAQRNWYLKAKI